jgi:hypothetical protein
MPSKNIGVINRDKMYGTEHGENQVQKFLIEQLGIITENVGRERVGWDLQFKSADPCFMEKNNITITNQEFEKKYLSLYGRTIEVKRDRKSDLTNNFFYEVWCNQLVGVPGCIAASKADTIVIVRSKEMIFLNRAVFVSWVVWNLYFNGQLGENWRNKTSGGKKGFTEMKNPVVSPHARGILIPIDDIKTVSIDVFKR